MVAAKVSWCPWALSDVPMMVVQVNRHRLRRPEFMCRCTTCTTMALAGITDEIYAFENNLAHFSARAKIISAKCDGRILHHRG